MKIKELKRTVNVSWSPAEQWPVMLAAGSAAQQVDASFSSNSYLELYSLNLDDPGFDFELKSSLQTQHKFQKLAWSGVGILVGGCDGGLLEFYSTERLLKNSTDALIASSTKHNGHVSALDINPFQKNLLASGASESEIFIWDLNNTSQPMAPGNKSQPYDHVQGLAWNQQVQHILASTFATRCVVWDLRKNEPIMKLSDSQSRTRWRAVSWHPSVATQLCIASDDDQAPHIQLWDLRLAASPLVSLERHQKGVMAVSWCKQDPDLFLSAGKDGSVLCWNPNNTTPGGELLCEVSQQQQWVFDVSWCPRDPSLLLTSSFDREVAVHSLLAGAKVETAATNQSSIVDSFGGVDSFSQLPAVSRAPAVAPAPRPQLPRAPRWLRRPRAARFSFGGKLVTFDKPEEPNSQKLVYISQVVSEPDIVERASELDAVLGSSLSQEPGATERLAEYCRQKGDAATEQSERYTWFFLRANFLPSFRSEVLNLLGFKQDEIPSKFKSSNAVTSDTAQPENIAALSRGESTETDAELSTDTSTDLSDAHTLIERRLANVDLGPSVTNVVIPNGEDTTGMICRALVCGNLEEAVELCLEMKRVADALIIASLGSQELLYKVQKYHLHRTASDPVSLVAGSLLLSKWDTLVQSSAPQSWRDTLAALVTHCEGEALAHYCEMLGDKLSKESDASLSDAASICYLCAMSPDPLVARWARGRRRDAVGLARLTELALLARRAAAARGRQLQCGGKLDSVLTEYASRLAAQGCLQSAFNSLESVPHAELRERLAHAIGIARAPAQQPNHQLGSRTRTVSGHSQKRGHLVAHNDVTNTYSAVPPYEAQNPWQQSSMPAPPQPSYPNAGGFPPHPAQAQPQPQPPQPPRPGSVGPQAGAITGRSKYKVDPSVQSAPLYNQYNFNNPIVSQPQPFGGYNSPIPDQYGPASVPNPGFNPINQSNTLNSLNPPSLNTINSLNSQTLNPIYPLNSVNPGPLNPIHQAVNGGYYNPQQAPIEPAVAAAPLQPKTTASGWNDPPMLSSKSKPKQDVPTQAPITHPLFGVEPPQHVPLAPAPGQYPGQQYPGQQNPGQQNPGQQYPGQQNPGQQNPGQQYPNQQYPGYQQYQQYPGQQFPGQQYPDQQQCQTQYPGAMSSGYPQQPESPALAPEPVPVQKQPIPEEHAVLQTAFDGLRTECSNRATNPQMKRKLEDVQRRLELLYDLLREYRLSENALSSLHTCVQLAQSGDYNSAGGVASALATGGDFAAVASFLPGLRTLLQLAAQLQVYVR